MIFVFTFEINIKRSRLDSKVVMGLDVEVQVEIKESLQNQMLYIEFLNVKLSSLAVKLLLVIEGLPLWHMT